MKLNVVFVALLGALGVYALARHSLRLGPLPSLVAGLAWSWSGWLPSRVAVGFYEACLMVAFPAVLALWVLPGDPPTRRRRWVLAALLLATLAVQLQLAVPILVLLMALLAAATMAQQRAQGERADRGLLLGAALILMVAALVGGVKFLPMLDVLAESRFRKWSVYPTHPDAWYFSPQQVWYALFHRVPAVPVLDRDGNPRIQEYMTLLPGFATLLLAALALPRALRRSSPALPHLLVGAVFLWLCFGPNAAIDGFRPLFSLPLFSSMRGPLRYTNLPVILTLALLAGLGFSVASSWLSRRGGILRSRGPWLLFALVVAGNLPAAQTARVLYRSSFLYPIEDLPTPDPIVSEGLSGTSSGGAHRLNLRKYVNVRRGVPTVYDPEDLPMTVGAMPAYRLQSSGEDTPELAYLGEAWLAGRDTLLSREPLGTARFVAYRGREVEVEVEARADATVMINQNGLPGWTCTGAPATGAVTPTTSEAAPTAGEATSQPLRVSERARVTWGLLGVEVGPGNHRVRCRWAPPLLGAGLATSALGLLSLLALWPWASGRGSGRRRSAPRSAGRPLPARAD